MCVEEQRENGKCENRRKIYRIVTQLVIKYKMVKINIAERLAIQSVI